MSASAMPRVLMIGPDLVKAPGGMATVEKNVIDAYQRRQGEVFFIPTFVEGSKPKKLAVAAAAYAKYLRHLKNCDLVHVHMASRASFDRKKVFMNAAFSRNVPVLLHLHGSEFAVWFDNECSEDKKNDIRSTFKKCSKVVVLSEEWRDFLTSRAICDEDRTCVLYNAVDVPEANKTDYSRNSVLFMGRLDTRKSPDVLLRAAQRVLADHPDARFAFGGDGDVTRYQKLAVELGVSDNCKFLGWISGAEKEKAFLENSIYCLPSKNEGMPMSVLEAMSYGLVALSTPVGGVPQVIADGQDGFLFPVDDDEALAIKLGALMSDADLKKRVGEAGRQRIERQFSMNAFIDKMIDLYKEIA